jgi:acid phosphatase type 7
VLTRTDPTVNFSWGSGSPHSSIGGDTFSVRWTGEVKADNSQTYTFSTVSNDGVRLWVGGQLLIDDWVDHPPTQKSGTITLQAGQWYPITLEYYEGVGTSVISLSYASASTPKQIVPADHLRPPAGGTDTTAPGIVDTAPRGGGTGTTLAVRPSVVFSEPVDSATLTTSTFTLRKAGAAGPVPAQVNYDGPNGVATLTPAATLDPGASYSATLKGGPDGVMDLAGNTLSADVVWGFSTGSGTVTTSLVAGAGDIACDPANPAFAGGSGTATECRQLATSDLLVQGGYDRVLMLGDAQYENGTFTAFQQSFHPSWGRVKSITSPVVGNHEYHTPGAAGYFQYFGSAAGDPTQGYYSFDLGSWHVIALNTNCAEVDCATGSRQERWLRADLAAHPAQCTLALSHHPRYSSGAHGDNPVIGPLYAALYEAGADVLLSGHDHDYERLAPSNPSDGGDTARGIRQFVVGTGGAHLRPFATIDSDSEIRSSTAFGVLELTLRDGAYDWRFVPEAGQTFTDSGSGACH